MPIPTVYTPIQPQPSIVAKPVVWIPNVWTAVQCPPIPPGIPEIFTVTVPSFQPVVSPAAYFGDPGLVITLTSTSGASGSATLGSGVATATCTFPGTITMTVTGNYTDYLFPNKEYMYRNDLPGGVLHLPTTTTSPSGYPATYGTLNQGSATSRQIYKNPLGGLPIAGTPLVGMDEEIPAGHNYMQHYYPDPNYMIIVDFTVVITSSCGIGAGTFPIKQIVYDDKDISAKRFVNRVNSQTGRLSDEDIQGVIDGL